MRRLLTIGHSYVIAANRRMAHEMALQGKGRWEVTAVAPARLPADLRDVTLEPIPDEACALKSLPLSIASIPHVRFYRHLRPVLASSWDVVHIWEEPYIVAGAQIATMAPRRARVVPATFQNIAKRYPPPFSLFERQVMNRAAGWIAFGRTVHDAQAPRPLYSAQALARDLARRRRRAFPARTPPRGAACASVSAGTKPCRSSAISAASCPRKACTR